MDDNEFNIWVYRMWELNREERLNYRDTPISYEEYYKSNNAWLKLRYEELKQKEVNK
jgi:hypothetical protein